MIIKILIPNDILNPLWDEDEKEEEEEVGGRVADELNEGFPHPLAKWPPGADDVGHGEEWEERPDPTNLQTLKWNSVKIYISRYPVPILQY